VLICFAFSSSLEVGHSCSLSFPPYVDLQYSLAQSLDNSAVDGMRVPVIADIFFPNDCDAHSHDYFEEDIFSVRNSGNNQHYNLAEAISDIEALFEVISG
jgi:hypothetical protein